MGRRTLHARAGRRARDDEQPDRLFNPQLDSGLARRYTQPLLRNFKFDSFRQNLPISLKNEEIADLQLRQRLTQMSSRCGTPTSTW